jgi:hypothetical protein
MKTVLLLLSILLITSCNEKWSLLAKGKQSDKKQNVTFELSNDWARLNESKLSIFLSKNGFELNDISIRSHLLSSPLPNTKKKIVKDILLPDLADVIAEEFKNENGISSFQLNSTEPSNVSGEEAIKITFTQKNTTGLVSKGIVYSFLYKNRVRIISFIAAKKVYFDRDKDEFEQMVKTLKFN